MVSATLSLYIIVIILSECLLEKKLQSRSDMKERDSRIDVIRLVALASLITVHFIKNMELYRVIVIGRRWLFVCLLRQFGMCCIPLFLLITGYLMKEKVYSKGYYRKIIRTLVIYVMASVISDFWLIVATGSGYNIKGLMLQILNFTACPYAWYVELYIGLFLIIPFLNDVYVGLDEKGKRRLIVTMLVLSALPSFTNVYRSGPLEWWLTPSSDATYFKIIPEYWRGVWPITYYYLGCWIRDRKISIKRSTNVFLIAVSMVLFALYNYWRSHGSPFIWGTWQDWGSWMNTVLSVLFFMLLLNIPYKRICTPVLATLANAVFGAYLLSWIPEQVVYKNVISHNPEPLDRVKYCPLILAVYIASIIMSLFLSGIYKVLAIGVKRLKEGKQ